MDKTRWKKIEDIFQEALDVPAERRAPFIAERSGDDDELRAEVERLVARFELEEEFLESPVWTDSAVLGNTLRSRVASSLEKEMAGGAADRSFIGEKIGAFVLTGQIGAGGMGVVFAAERADGEFRQKAAVKLIKRGMDTDFIVRRFRRERQILADLNHPFIALLFDGGTTESGLPYFIMEFIEGRPLLKYCAERDLDLPEKLGLFLQVCSAVSYAHERKIIHRDLKPSNILVTADGVPKLLDFGIAKILDTDSIHESMLPTATQMRLMTPEYASPEQICGEAVTPASDQYSLGVVLYELLTGARPYKFSSRAPHEIARVICEEIPTGPASGDAGRSLAAGDENDLKLDDEACRKLDRIVLKTLRKDPAERYGSIEELAADIRRFLQNAPVEAEAFEKDEGKLPPEAAEEKIADAGLKVDTREIAGAAPGGNAVVRKNGRAAVSPRRTGLKQGAFLIIVSFLLLPILVILTLSAALPPQFPVLVFFLLFLGGLIRLIYALFFEDKNAAAHLPEALSIPYAETRLIESPPPAGRESSFEQTPPGEQTPAGENLPPADERSIAVLPFINLNTLADETTGGGSEFLGTGLADALITRLSSVRRLLVRPTSSVLRFAAADTDSVAAGRQLGVRFVVEGKIIRSEKRIRVSVLLSDVENRSTVWADKFDEEFTDVLELEDSISAKIAGRLLPKLTGEERRQLAKRGTDNVSAYESYLRGRFYQNSFTEDSFSKAFAAYHEAIEKDPDYALAYAGLADYYIWLGVYGIVAPQDCYPPAKEAAEKAIAIDSGLAEAYAALGFARLCGDFDWEAAEKNMLRAIEINPHYTLARLWYSFVLQSAGRFDEGIEQAKRAVELDPLTYINHHVLGWAYYFARRFDEAVAQTEKTIRKFPLVGLGEFTLSWFLRQMGESEAALAASENALKLSGESLFVLLGHAQALAAAGRKAETGAALEKVFEQGARQYLSFYQMALVYAYLGDKRRALDALDRAFEDREGWLIWLKTEPALDLLRGEPRFRELLRKTGRDAKN